MRRIFFILSCLLFALPVFAQEETQSPYEIALQRIEEARISNARELYLSNLGLEELPPEIGNLSSLEFLHLRYNQLSSLPPEIGNLSRLKILYLERNALTQLPPEIGNLSNLGALLLSHNQLSSLPAEIGELHNLVALYLYSNQLSSLPPEIGNLSNLQVLYLFNNQLTSLPAEIEGLVKLCYLQLEGNSLQYLPEELGRLNNLGFNTENCNDGYSGIVVDGNPLISPPPEVVAQGTAAILVYLRNEAWWHIKRLIIGGASFAGIIVAAVLGIRWRNQRRKGKKRG